jgi:CheY-like chemotaxis protein
MVYGILKQNEGFINVYSEPGKGTTFRIYLPLIKAAAVEGKKAVDAEYPKGGTETILMAEDDPSLRKLTALILEQGGYKLITANNGEEAVEKFMENKDKIQLLLLDVIMPKKNGRDAYDEIRKVMPKVPVLFASGYSPDMLHDKALIEKGVAMIYKTDVTAEPAEKGERSAGQGKITDKGQAPGRTKEAETVSPQGYTCGATLAGS